MFSNVLNLDGRKAMSNRMNTRYALDSVVMAPISHHSQNMDLSQLANCGAKLDRNDSYSKKGNQVSITAEHVDGKRA